MRIKTIFSLLCLMLLLLSIGLLDVRANPCGTYLSDYESKLSAYKDAETDQPLTIMERNPLSYTCPKICCSTQEGDK